jgi:hypothetical protein
VFQPGVQRNPDSDEDLAGLHRPILDLRQLASVAALASGLSKQSTKKTPFIRRSTQTKRHDSHGTDSLFAETRCFSTQEIGHHSFNLRESADKNAFYDFPDRVAENDERGEKP